jgi:hypothetical protein
VQFATNPDCLIRWGAFPPASDWEDQVAHREDVAKEFAEHPSNGFQYGVDISAGNVECGYLKTVGGKPIVVTEDTDGAQPATYCFYDSWR